MQLKTNIALIIFLTTFFSSISNSKEIFLSLKKDKVNVRYGPSFESPVKYIYRKINLPIKQIDKKENWRRIIDFKNNSGWIHRSQLKALNSIPRRFVMSIKIRSQVGCQTVTITVTMLAYLYYSLF